MSEGHCQYFTGIGRPRAEYCFAPPFELLWLLLYTISACWSFREAFSFDLGRRPPVYSMSNDFHCFDSQCKRCLANLECRHMVSSETELSPPHPEPPDIWISRLSWSDAWRNLQYQTTSLVWASLQTLPYAEANRRNSFI